MISSLDNLTFLTEKSGKFNFGAITDRPLIGRDAVSSIFARIAMGASIDSAGSNSLEKKIKKELKSDDLSVLGFLDIYPTC